LQLNKENLDLNALISNLVDYFKSQLEREKKKNGGELSLQYELNRSKPIFVEAYRDRLVRVIHNFLDNSVKRRVFSGYVTKRKARKNPTM
jgi:signal transduction histidine kinase